VLYLQYKWVNDLENPIINNNLAEKKEENESNSEKGANIRINNISASLNNKSEKINEKLFNNSSMMIFSEIKENTDKSKQF
jgi:hypothetical protein